MSKARDSSHIGRPGSRRSAPGALVGGLCLPALLLFLAQPAFSQQPSTLNGTVRSSDGIVLAGAQIVVAGRDTGVLTAADGHYEVSGVQAGERRVEVRRIGYHTAIDTLLFVSGQPTQWDVALDVDPVTGDSLDVTGVRGRTPQLEAFYTRRDRGNGSFFTRREIEAMNAREITDILRRVPGARVVPIPGPFGTTNVLQLNRSQGTSATTCPISYYINGVPFPVRAEIGIDAYVRAQDVEAMEVYNGSSRVPPEFTSAGQTSRCGVVAVWTRVGGQTGAGG